MNTKIEKTMDPKMEAIMDCLFIDGMVSNINMNMHELLEKIVCAGGDLKVYGKMDNEFKKGYTYSFTKPWRPGVKFILDFRMITIVDEEVNY